MKNFKTVFKKIRGKIVPIRVALNQAPDELQKIMHARKALSSLRATPTSPDRLSRKFSGIFYNLAKKQSKAVGQKIGKRLAKLNKKKSLKLGPLGADIFGGEI